MVCKDLGFAESGVPPGGPKKERVLGSVLRSPILQTTCYMLAY